MERDGFWEARDHRLRARSVRDRGGESWTLGDLGGGGGRVQPLNLLCLSSWEGERESERMRTQRPVGNQQSVYIKICSSTK